MASGWTIAHDLKAGDRLRMVGGDVQIDRVEAAGRQRVYNLTIARNHNFMVGKEGLLVHDFGFVQPVSEPFDHENKPASSTRK